MSVTHAPALISLIASARNRSGRGRGPFSSRRQWPETVMSCPVSVGPLHGTIGLTLPAPDADGGSRPGPDATLDLVKKDSQEAISGTIFLGQVTPANARIAETSAQ